METKFWKIGFFTALTSFVLLILGVRTLLGHTLEVMNYITFAIFASTVGIMSSLLLFYRYTIAYRIFFVVLIVAFAFMFWNFTTGTEGYGEVTGILDLFIISSFGLAIAVIIQFIVIFIRKQKNQEK